MGTAGTGPWGQGLQRQKLWARGSTGGGGCGVSLCWLMEGGGTRSAGWLSPACAAQRCVQPSLSHRLLPSRLRPAAACAAGAGDGVHRGPAAAHAVLCRRGELPLQLGPPGQLALRAPPPAPLLLPDPQQRPGRLPPQGRPPLLGLARVPPVRAGNGRGWAAGSRRAVVLLVGRGRVVPGPVSFSPVLAQRCWGWGCWGARTGLQAVRGLSLPLPGPPGWGQPCPIPGQG